MYATHINNDRETKSLYMVRTLHNLSYVGQIREACKTYVNNGSPTHIGCLVLAVEQERYISGVTYRDWGQLSTQIVTWIHY